MAEIHDLEALLNGIASPEEIRSQSLGEVRTPETIYYYALKLEQERRLGEAVFGPEWEHFQEKHLRMILSEGIKGDHRGSEVGHIELAAPCCHVGYLQGEPSPISLLLDLPPPCVEQLLYFAAAVVTRVDRERIGRLWNRVVTAVEEERRKMDWAKEEIIAYLRRCLAEAEEYGPHGIDWDEFFPPPLEKPSGDDDSLLDLLRVHVAERIEYYQQTTRQRQQEWRISLEVLKRVEAGQLLTADVPYYALLSLLNHLDLRFGPPYANLVNTGIGAEFVRDLLAQIDLEVLAGQLHQEVSETGGLHQAQARERLSLVEAFRQSGTRPEWMILTVIPVLPPVLWPMVSLDGCRYARRCPHLGDLYRLVIQRNNRLQRLQELGVPLVLIVHEKRMLQEAVDALIELTWDVYLRLRTQKNGHDPAKD